MGIGPTLNSKNKASETNLSERKRKKKQNTICPLEAPEEREEAPKTETLKKTKAVATAN